MSSNKVFEGKAEIGKSSMGWFFGFKLHLVVNDRGDILSFCITRGNVDDRKPVKNLCKKLFGKQTSSEGGRPTLPTRLMVGLHYLKALYDASDESVVAKWIENPYWQYFCGEETFQHELPCHPSSLVKWRQRVGAEGVEKMLKQLLKSASQQKALKPTEVERVNVDTTVQEKAIAFPTDARLYDKARRALVRVARKYQLKLRQSYVRLGKQALFFQSRYAAARQGKRAKQQTRKLRT